MYRWLALQPVMAMLINRYNVENCSLYKPLVMRARPTLNRWQRNDPHDAVDRTSKCVMVVLKIVAWKRGQGGLTSSFSFFCALALSRFPSRANQNLLARIRFASKLLNCFSEVPGNRVVVASEKNEKVSIGKSNPEPRLDIYQLRKINY